MKKSNIINDTFEKVSLVVDLNNVNLNKCNEVELAIAKAKKEFNDNHPKNKMLMSKRENHLLKVDNRWFRRAWLMIKRLLGWK